MWRSLTSDEKEKFSKIYSYSIMFNKVLFVSAIFFFAIIFYNLKEINEVPILLLFVACIFAVSMIVLFWINYRKSRFDKVKILNTFCIEKYYEEIEDGDFDKHIQLYVKYKDEDKILVAKVMNNDIYDLISEKDDVYIILKNDEYIAFPVDLNKVVEKLKGENNE